MTREQILTKLRERMLAFAASHIARDIAEDLVQEAMLVLEQKYAGVQGLENLLPLSLRILRFKLMAAHRKSARHGDGSAVSVDEIPVLDPRDNPETAAARAEMQTRLRTALRGLEIRCREMFRLKLEGRTFPEMQAILGARSINTIYTWDARCRQRLLDLMGGRWEAGRK